MKRTIILISLFALTSYSGITFAQSSNELVRFNGEYGLYVKKGKDSIEIRWITEKDDNGYLEVYHSGSLSYSYTTSISKFHSVRFPFMAEGRYDLRFGSQNYPDDQHITSIDLFRQTPRAGFKFEGIDSVYVVGDSHGEYKSFSKLLTNNALADQDLNWCGGQKHLVMLGDFFDRGQDVTKLLWMLYRLEKQAELAGGKVHILLGNHEIMTFTKDLRYLSTKEKTLAMYHGLTYHNMYDMKTSLLGEWLASKPAIIKIDKLLFSHAGVITNYADFSISAFNDSTYAFMQEPIFPNLLETSLDSIYSNPDLLAGRRDFFYSSLSPFWYRGYAKSDTLEPYLDLILQKNKVSLQVAGHTPFRTITQLYNGKFIGTDLTQKASEILLLVRGKRNKYIRKKYDLEGREIPF